MQESQVILVPPNGGFGWIVVLGAIFINMFNKSLFSVFGLLFGPYFKTIDVLQSEIALVMNLASFFSSFSAIFTGALLKFFSIRKLTIFACFLTSFGISLSSFTSSVYQIIFTFSLLTGTGLGLLVNLTLIAVTSYFTTKKKKAVSFSMAGTGIGQIILPQIVKNLNKMYSIDGSILIMGAIMLNGVVGALLFRPVKRYLVPRIIDETHALNIPKNVERTPRKNNNTFWQKVINTMDLTLLRDIRFVILCFVLACVYAVSIDFTLILPYFLQETKKLNKDQTALCLSVLASFDLISRLSFHFITDRMKLTSRQTFVIGILLLGIIKTIMTFLTAYQYILIACSVYGYIRALVIVNQIIIISEHCTMYYPERFPGALGLNMVACGISVMTIGQVFGAFRNHFDNFSYSFYFEDTFIAAVSSTWLIEYLYRLKK